MANTPKSYLESESGLFSLSSDISYYIPENSKIVAPVVFFAMDKPRIDGIPFKSEIDGLGWKAVFFSPNLSSYFKSSVLSPFADRKRLNIYSSARYLVSYDSKSAKLALAHPELFAGVAFFGDVPDEYASYDEVEMPVFAKRSVSQNLLGFYEKSGSPILVSDDDGRMFSFLSGYRRYPAFKFGRLAEHKSPISLGLAHKTGVYQGYGREWYEYVPNGGNLPLVLVLHGRSGDGEEFVGRSGWLDAGMRNKCILVFPTGARGVDRKITYWNFYDSQTEGFSDDNLFLHDLILDLSSSLPVDKTRIYVSGQSMGSMMSLSLSFRYPKMFAASASSAALLPSFMDKIGTMKISRRSIGVPLWVTLGTDDDNVCGKYTYGDNDAVRWFMDNAKEWNHCVEDSEHDHSVFHTRVSRTKEGIPKAVYSYVRGKTHAIVPEEVELFYEYMSRFRRMPDGSLEYQS